MCRVQGTVNSKRAKQSLKGYRDRRIPSYMPLRPRSLSL